MACTNQQTFLYRDRGPTRTIAASEKLVFVSRVASFNRVDPEPSSANIISPADAVRRYWRWDSMPETMRRLA
jgi:hypothetical protein